MSLATLEASLDWLADLNRETGRTTIIWHGGEPLLVGRDFYTFALGLQSRMTHKFSNHVQTNGTLLDEGWREFFVRNDFHVGISLDGVESTHDMNRPFKDGTGSFASVYGALSEYRLLKKSAGVLCVVNKNTIGRLEEIYGFLKANRLSAKFNAQLPAGRALQHRDLAVTPQEFGTAMVSLFDRWFHDHSEPVIDIDPFGDIIGDIGASANKRTRLPYPTGCLYRNMCAESFISIAPDGSIYPCGRWCGDPRYRMGDVNRSSIDDYLSSSVRRPFLERQTGVVECVSCEFVRICNGGCPDNAWLMSGDLRKKDGFCDAYKMLFSHIGGAVRRELGRS